MIFSTLSIAGRFISCSLPQTTTSTALSKGDIDGALIPDKEEEFWWMIDAALGDQNVVHEKRLPIRGHPDMPMMTTNRL